MLISRKTVSPFSQDRSQGTIIRRGFNISKYNLVGPEGMQRPMKHKETVFSKVIFCQVHSHVSISAVR